MATSRYIVVHDRTVKAAYYGFSEVGGSSDEEWHGEQEEGGGGVELHGEVFCGEGGGGETSQVAKHLIDCQVHQVQLKKKQRTSSPGRSCSANCVLQVISPKIWNKLPFSKYSDRGVLHSGQALKLAGNFAATDNGSSDWEFNCHFLK